MNLPPAVEYNTFPSQKSLFF